MGGKLCYDAFVVQFVEFHFATSNHPLYELLVTSFRYVTFVSMVTLGLLATAKVWLS